VDAAHKRAGLLARHPYLDQPDVEIVVNDITGGRFYVDPDVTYWFEQVTVRGVDFSRGRFGWYRQGVFGGAFYASGSSFLDCDFTSARFDRGSFGARPHSTYQNCRFDGAEIWSRQGRSSIDLDDVRFTRCSFDGAKVRGWLAFNAEFVGCSFATRVDRCDFYGSPQRETKPRRLRNAFLDNDFSRGELVYSRFRAGIDIDAQRWPHEGYVRLERAARRIAQARERLGKVDPAIRLDVELGLGLLELDAQSQETLLCRRYEPESSVPEEATDAMWRLLGV
jgi:hypothetical protein